MEIPAFDLVTFRTDDAAVVRVIGELDLATAPQLGDVLADLTGQGTIHVTVDLSKMVFIDSTGLHHLVVAFKRQRERGGDMVLRSPRPNTLRVLEMVGLTTVFTIT